MAERQAAKKEAEEAAKKKAEEAAEKAEDAEEEAAEDEDSGCITSVKAKVANFIARVAESIARAKSEDQGTSKIDLQPYHTDVIDSLD
jgi:hypothetical protein